MFQIPVALSPLVEIRPVLFSVVMVPVLLIATARPSIPPVAEIEPALFSVVMVPAPVLETPAAVVELPTVETDIEMPELTVKLHSADTFD
jgi:hypothetical protein